MYETIENSELCIWEDEDETDWLTISVIGFMLIAGMLLLSYILIKKR